MSLVKTSFLYLFFNLIILTLFLSASGTSSTYGEDIIDYNDTSVSISDMDDLNDKYVVSDSVLDNAGIPSWFYIPFLALDGIFGLLLGVAWVRGVA